MWNSFPAKTVGLIVAVVLLGAGTLLLLAFGHAATSPSQPEKAGGANPSLKEIALDVPTIWCSTCKPRVEASARSVPDVREVRFDSKRIQIVLITYDPTQTSPRAIIEVIEMGGDKVAGVIEQ